MTDSTKAWFQEFHTKYTSSCDAVECSTIKCPDILHVMEILRGLCPATQLTDHGIVLLRDLVSADQSWQAYFGNRKNAAEPLAELESGTSLVKLNVHRKVLIGYVYCTPDGASKKRPGSLCLIDGTGCIEVQISADVGKKLNCLIDSWYLLTEWNVRYGDKRRHVEVHGMEAMNVLNKDKTVLDVLPPGEAARLLSYRSKLTLNVIGNVTGVSEIFRYQSELMFLIDVAHMVTVLVKDTNLLYWQKLIIPQNVYVVSKLKPACVTIKGKKHPVFLTSRTSKSQVFPEELCQVTELSADEWLTQKKVQVDKELLTIPETVPRPEDGQDKFFSYKGVITKVLDRSLGIYELDFRIRLYVSCVPAYHKYRFMQVGTSITVYNSHYKGSRQIPKIRLYCCMYSSIRVTEFSPLEYTTEVPQPSAEIQSLLYPQGLTSSQLDQLYGMKIALQRKFQYSVFRKRELDRMLDAILTYLKPQREDKVGRNLLTEFMSAEHSCCILSADSQDDRLAYLPLFKNICDTNMEPGCCSGVEGGEDDLDKFWSYSIREVNSGEVLIGKVCLSARTGFAQLMDDSGGIDITATCFSANLIHSCHGKCCCDSVAIGDCFPCPFIHSCCVGKLIAIKKFKLISEFIRTNHDLLRKSSTVAGKSNDWVSKQRSCKYVAFSMCDAVVIDSDLNLTTMTESDRIGNLCSEPSCERLSSKRNCPFPVEGIDSIKQGKHCENSDALVSVSTVLGNEIIESSVDGSSKEQHAKMSEENKVNLDVKRKINSAKDLLVVRQQQEVSEAKERPGVRDHRISEMYVVVVHKESLRVECKYSQAARLRFCVEVQFLNREVGLVDREANGDDRVILVFRGEAVKWYSVISPGSVYKLTSPEELPPLQNLPPNSLVNKAIQKSCAKRCLVVPAIVEVEECLDGIDRCSTVEDVIETTVTKVVDESFTGSLVSFEGTIVCRSHGDQLDGATQTFTTENPKLKPLGIISLGQKSILLEVKDLQTDSKVKVYMNVESTPYPLCLLPGAHIRFCRLQRNTSRKGNIYCQVIVLSSLRVVAMLPFQYNSAEIPSHCDEKYINRQCQDEENISDTAAPSIPKLPLVDIWREVVAPSVFQWICHVQQVLKCSLKCLCCTCGSVFINSRCSNRGCSSLNSRFSARLSFIIEDGTSIAVVTANGKVVPSLLKLTALEWQTLEELVQEEGEVYVQQTRPEFGTPAEKFVYLLCNNPKVKNSWNMMLKLKMFPKGQEGAKSSGVDINAISNEEFAQRMLDTGLAKFTTRSLPLLQFDCTHVEPVDYTKWTLHNLTYMLEFVYLMQID